MLKGRHNSLLFDSTREYREFLNDLATEELLVYIYFVYPNSVEESVGFRSIKPRIEDYILSPVKKEKISASRAAEL